MCQVNWKKLKVREKYQSKSQQALTSRNGLKLSIPELRLDFPA
jgi:hypothetical protein